MYLFNTLLCVSVFIFQYVVSGLLALSCPMTVTLNLMYVLCGRVLCMHCRVRVPG